MTGCPGPPWQAGVELSAQVDALHAEKEVLRRSVSEKECELLSTRGLIEEKELQLSQEADKASREIRELQGRLLEKVQCCVESPWGEMFGGCQPMQPVGYHSYQQSWDGKGLSKNVLLMGMLFHLAIPPASQSNQEQSLQQKLLEDQFGVLQETVREAQDILRDAMAKLDDPLHLRCTSSPGKSCSSRG